MENIHTAVNQSTINVNATKALNPDYSIDLEGFASITGAEVKVSSTTAEQAQQALRDLQVACKDESEAYYNIRAQFLSDGSGPAKAVDFEALIGRTIPDIEAKINELAGEYGQYVQALNVAQTRSNAFLFGILANVYDTYAVLLQQSEKEQKRILNRIDAYMLNKNISVTGKTYPLSKLLMCVFVGADAKKINSYYSAIAYAHKRGIKSDDFVQFAQDCGGLQAMRLANAASKKSQSTGQMALTRDEKLEQAQQWANTQQLAVFDSEDVGQNVDATASKIVLIATPLSGGKYAIHAALNDRSIVDAALLAYYKVNKEQLENTKCADAFENEQARQDAQIDAALAGATAAI